MLSQAKPVGGNVDVIKDFALARETFGPLPFLLKFLGEGVGVLQALDIATRAWIPIPEPGTADAIALLEDNGRQTQPLQPIQRIQPGKSCSDNDGVVSLRRVRTIRHLWHFRYIAAFCHLSNNAQRFRRCLVGTEERTA